MAARRFVVFQDTPTPITPAPSQPAPANVLAPSNSEKENIHPVTGKVALITKNTGKPTKEKATALATKFYIEDSVLKKKQKLATDGTVEDGCPEPKKRKSSSASSSQGKSKKVVSKTASATRVRKTTRRAPALPSLEEDSGDERSGLNQAEIDSKCVELTVKSLADVSEAFETSPVTEKPAEKTKPTTTASNPSTTVKHRDYFAVPLTSLTITPLSMTTSTASPHDPKSKTDDKSASDAPSEASKSTTIEAHAFSTPERKQIYSAFTFSSPSPASKRLTEKPSSLDIDTIALFERLTLDLDFKD